MAKTLEKALSPDELKHLADTVVFERESAAESVPEFRPKMRYVATKETTALRIMGGVVSVLQQKGMNDQADELKRLILSGNYDEPADALKLMGDYVRLQIVNEDGEELGTI
jgi:hypothetical protein